MNILDKGWKRLLIAFALGASLSRVIGVITYKKVEIAAIVIWIILYFTLTWLYTRQLRE